MNLVWAKYNNKNRLLLYLGEKNGKIIGIESTDISTGQAEAIRKQSKLIQSMDLKERISSIDSQIVSVKNIVKTYNKKSLHVLESYDIS